MTPDRIISESSGDEAVAGEPTVQPKDDPNYVTLSAASTECGASLDVLRCLVEERALSGVTRARNGTPYLHRDHIPSWHQANAALREVFTREAARARSALRTVEIETEALRNDVNEAMADPLAELGDDLLSFHEHGYNPEGRTLTSALTQLHHATIRLQLVQRLLRDLNML